MCNRKLRTGRAFEEHMVLEHRDIFANQDVLRTVLQALSTALYLKTEDVQQGGRTSQGSAMMRMPNMNTGLVPGMVRQRPPFGAISQNSSFVDGMMRQRAPMMINQQAPSALKVKQKQAPVNKQPAPASVAVVKTPDKKTPEEDAKVLNKLYEDYADIGRPISRSMKQKLLLSPSGNSTSKKNELETGGNSSQTDRASHAYLKADENSVDGSAGKRIISENNTTKGTDTSNLDSVPDAGEPESKKPRLSDGCNEGADSNRSEVTQDLARTACVSETASS